MPIQTTYTAKPAPGAVGRRANMEEWNTITRIAEDAGIGFGQPVQRGTGDDQIELFDGSGNFLGITEADQTLTTGVPGQPLSYPVGHNTPVCEYGVIWVMAGGTCTAGGPVYWNASAGTYSDDSGDELIPNAEFDSSATTGNVVKVRLRRVPPAP